MKIRFLGTGAADWDWSLPLKPGVRGSTVTLLDDHLLIDAGETGWENLRRFGVDAAKITDLLVTHSHDDHFDPEDIRRIATAPGRTKKLTVYTTREAAAHLDTSVLDAEFLYGGRKFSVGALSVEALPANHAPEYENEGSFHFLFELPGGKRLLYALDGAWMTSPARIMLKKRRLDMIVWDATSGTSEYDWRFADHNDLFMIRYMREGLSRLGAIDGKTVHVFDHIARTLWPDAPEERAAAAREFGGILAEDGMTLDL